eukprot:XP_011661327.1 PREDICTED: uncharacterized protein LOC105436945 [Strongylocentrotus purpuratus]
MVNVDFDGILKEIAKSLCKDTEIDDLGVALGLQPSDIRRYINANAPQGGSYMGTLDMLRTWRKGQKASTEKAVLNSALLKAGFVRPADEYLSSSNPDLLSGQQQETATGPSPATMAAATSSFGSKKREVTNLEITTLSKLLPGEKYSELCEILGFDFWYIQNIKRKNFMDPIAAFKEILQEWKQKAGFMNDLDEALKQAEVGGLVSRYKN